jgi:hypothetical protein
MSAKVPPINGLSANELMKKSEMLKHRGRWTHPIIFPAAQVSPYNGKAVAALEESVISPRTE